MSKQEKWVTYVIIIAIIAGLVWWYVSPHAGHEAGEQALQNQTASSTVGAQQAILPTPAGDVSDAALNQDVAAVDANISALASDTAAADQSVTASQQPAPDLTQ